MHSRYASPAIVLGVRYYVLRISLRISDNKILFLFFQMKIGNEIFALTSYGKLERKVNRELTSEVINLENCLKLREAPLQLSLSLSSRKICM